MILNYFYLNSLETMAQGAIKVSKKLLELAQQDAEKGVYLDAILTLRSIQRDLEKWL